MSHGPTSDLSTMAGGTGAAPADAPGSQPRGPGPNAEPRTPLPTLEQLLTQPPGGGVFCPIRGCPGRFVLRGVPEDLTPEAILGQAGVAIRCASASAPDEVIVAPLDGGAGLISYRRRIDGSYLHTVNTPEGFRRKLAQLGLRLGAAGSSGPVEEESCKKK